MSGGSKSEVECKTKSLWETLEEMLGFLSFVFGIVHI